MQISHYLPRALPEPLQGLGMLALDMRWSFNHGADELWRTVDPDLWDATANPWLIIESVADERLAELARDAEFLSMLETQLSERDAHFTASTWFSMNHADKLTGQIAFFSMEFGLSEALPIYAGGLGVLAGDYLKTACDLGVPAVGVGLLYQEGYFRQIIDASGAQIEQYPYNDPTMLPIVPLRDDDGEWVRIKIALPGRTLRLRTWVATVGRRSLFLLDSNDLLNDPADRGITSQLYGGGPEMRLQQEIVLGIGGWRLLDQLGIECTVSHLNEGHAAFAVLERARAFMRRSGEPFAVALRATRAGNLFTTHTPVEAGFDRFDPSLMSLYFSDYAATLGLELQALLALGRRDPSAHTEPFNMAYLAIHGAGAVNGVSRLHGEVSRRIFEPLFPRWPRPEVPIGHVTNGVHTPTWDSAAADKLWTGACGKARWRGELDAVEANLRQVDDDALWQVRRTGRRRVVDFLNARRARQSGHRHAGVPPRSDMPLDPDILTIGFARRFAEYKRNNLLLRDPGRLSRLLASRDRPVQLVVGGKAHPHDDLGKEMVRAWHDFVARPELRGRAMLVEDYDMIVAGELVQGVDVWLNMPRRPWEASGTSGMKVLVNGGLNLSELEGWWAEAYGPEVGWVLGDGSEPTDTETCDAREADALYRLLESEVVPSFYERDEHGLPRQWIALMRESMAALTTRFSSNRMVREYVERYYLPLAASANARNIENARRLEEWHSRLDQSWSSIHFGGFGVTPVAEGQRFDVQVYLYQLPPDAVSVELYANASGNAPSERHVLSRGEPLHSAGNAYTYSVVIATDRPAAEYTPRVVPVHALASIPLEASQILWFR